MSDLIDCEVTGMTEAGEGVARHEGKVVFIPGALVGERVRAEVIGRGARSDRARIVEILAPAGRQETPCRHDHPRGCGGCSLLHATRPAQASAKRLIVADALQRLAGQDPAVVRETLTPGPDLGYRNRARFGVDRNGHLTYVARSDAPARGTTRPSIEIETCAVLDARLDRLRADLDGGVAGVEEVELRIGARTGESLVILHGASRLPASIDPTKMDASILLKHGDRLVPVRGFPQIHEVVLGSRFRVSAGSFFQVNTDGAECIATFVSRLVSVSRIERALDLYAGVGLFTVSALARAGGVLGVELDPAAADDFRHNTSRFPNTRLRTEPVVDVLKDLRPGRDVFDLAIINPPRAGMGEEVVRVLAPLQVPRLVMVSCDPGSLGRDVAALVRAGYALREATPVDQFPGTAHVETIVCLELR